MEKDTDNDDKIIKETDDKEYIEIKANSMEDLISQVSKYAYDNSVKSVMTDSEKAVAQQLNQTIADYLLVSHRKLCT